MHPAIAPAPAQATSPATRCHAAPEPGGFAAGQVAVSWADMGQLDASPPEPTAGTMELFPARDALGQGLSGALLESRQRWRDFATLAADLVFETDAAGRLTFLAPDHVLGWDAAMLLGQSARCLLLRPDPTPSPCAPRHGT